MTTELLSPDLVDERDDAPVTLDEEALDAQHAEVIAEHEALCARIRGPKPLLEIRDDGTLGISREFDDRTGIIEPPWRDRRKLWRERPGRKSFGELNRQRWMHAEAVADMREADAQGGPVLPPEALSSLPLIATWYLYHEGADLRRYLSPSALLCHRRQIRDALGLDILVPYSEPVHASTRNPAPGDAA